VRVAQHPQTTCSCSVQLAPPRTATLGLRKGSMQAEALSVGPVPEEVLYLPEANMPLDQRISLLEEERDTLVGGCHNSAWLNNHPRAHAS
jgi:hypothetical protein